MGIFLFLLNVLLGALNLYVSDGADFNLFMGAFSFCTAAFLIGTGAYK